MKLQVVKYTALSMMLYEANFVFVDGKTIKDKYDESELDKWEYPVNFDYYEVVYWNENNRILMLKTKSKIQMFLEKAMDIPQGYEKGEYPKLVAGEHFSPMTWPADKNAVAIDSTSFIDYDAVKAPVTIPKYVKMGDGGALSALRLIDKEYYRDGGRWSVGYKIVNGVLVSWCPKKGMPWLHNVPLIEVTEEEWRESNGEYAPY
jgi:hypothetical protein